MLAAILMLLPFLLIMFSQGDKIRKLQQQLYEKEQENKRLKLQLGDPFRGEIAEGIAFGLDEKVDGAKFSAIEDFVEGDES